MWNSLQGYRTLIVGFLLTVGPFALNYLGHIDWTQYVSPRWSTVIVGAIVIAMRLVTSTPVGTRG